jgi:signal transduction histidine kinase
MPAEAREKIDLLRKRVTRLETLLEDILRYSRAGRMVDSPEKVDTGELVRQIAEPLAADGSFRIDIAAAMPVLIAARTPLEQVFSNLLVNAVKHHDRGKGNIAVTVRDGGAYWEFAVSDDGPGIPAEFHDRVFQMFQTLKSRDRTEGSGLGMSIVKKLVEWQGGRVWIVSDGRGAAVHFLWKKNARG